MNEAERIEIAGGFTIALIEGWRIQDEAPDPSAAAEGPPPFALTFDGGGVLQFSAYGMGGGPLADAMATGAGAGPEWRRVRFGELSANESVAPDEPANMRMWTVFSRAAFMFLTYTGADARSPEAMRRVDAILATLAHPSGGKRPGLLSRLFGR